MRKRLKIVHHLPSLLKAAQRTRKGETVFQMKLELPQNGLRKGNDSWSTFDIRAVHPKPIVMGEATCHSSQGPVLCLEGRLWMGKKTNSPLREGCVCLNWTSRGADPQGSLPKEGVDIVDCRYVQIIFRLELLVTWFGISLCVSFIVFLIHIGSWLQQAPASVRFLLSPTSLWLKSPAGISKASQHLTFLWLCFCFFFFLYVCVSNIFGNKFCSTFRFRLLLRLSQKDSCNKMN